jgi:competence protein ComEC
VRDDGSGTTRTRHERGDVADGAPVRLGLVARLAVLRPAGRVALRLRLAVAADRLGDAVRRDLDAGLALPGLVVLFACGIVLYFQLPHEPWLPAVLAVALSAVAVTAVRRRRGHAARLAAAITALLLGVAAVAIETWRVAAPRLDHERTVTVEGRVVDLDATATGGLRLTVDVVRMEGRGLTPETTPTRISATLTTRGWRPDVGDGVRFKARLKPPEGPVMPGGYDFARHAWFEGRGAGGYILGRATPLDLGPPATIDRLLAPIGSLRHIIAERVRADLPGATGAIGAALMVGEQRAIPESAGEPLRASGLTHIVSISGLHMSLVAGGVIVAVRGLLALFPFLALTFPIKKWAAAAAFVAATVYLLLSGNQVAALRSHLMLSVALLAVLVDRPAITMHTVAVSAALILAVDPSAVMEPSFRMSFLAVIALVASYDLYRAWTARRPPPSKDAGLAGHLFGGILRQIEGFAFSSLVAGLATAPVIAGVFFRAAPYSILANMAVLPVTGLVIMPAAVVAALAMPFGLDHWPLQVMGLGIDWMIAVGRWTAALPAGSGLVGAPHPAMMPLGIAGVLWLSAWKTRIRLFGLVPALLSVLLLFAGPRPDVMIGRHGAPIAVRGDDGRLHVLGARRERFDTAIWLAADRDPRTATAAADLADGWTCDPLGCIFRRSVTATPAAPGGEASPKILDRASVAEPVPDASGATPAVHTSNPETAVGAPETGSALAAAGPTMEAPALEIAVVHHPLAFAEDCRRATLIVTPLIAPPGCRDRTTVVDRLDLARSGAMSLDFVGPTRRMAEPDLAPADTAAVPPDRDPPERSAAIDPLRDPDTPPWSVENPPAAVPRWSEGDATSPATTPILPIRPDRIAPAPTASADRTGTASHPPDTGVRPGSTDDLRSATAWPVTALPTEPHLRRDLYIHTSLPAGARPWTPRDPRIERIARDVGEAEAAARAPPPPTDAHAGDPAAISPSEPIAAVPPTDIDVPPPFADPRDGRPSP